MYSFFTKIFYLCFNISFTLHILLFKGTSVLLDLLGIQIKWKLPDENIHEFPNL